MSSEEEKSPSTAPQGKPSMHPNSLIGNAVSRMSLQLILLVLVGMAAFAISPSSPINPVAYTMPLAPNWTGPLTINTRLQSAELMLKGRIVAPESIAVGPNGALYTALSDGKIISVQGEQIKEIGHTSSKGNLGEENYGHPLGLRIHNNTLFVVDAHQGILRLSMEGEWQEVLVDMKEESPKLNNIEARFIDDMDISESGIIYFSDMSSRHPMEHAVYEILEAGPHGTLFSYNVHTKEIKVLLSGLYAANGVQLSDDERYVLVSETTRARIVRYWLKGPLTGTWDIFAENLPGYPDNIRKRSAGGYWVAMAAVRSYECDVLAPYPQIRSYIAKLLPYSMLRSALSGKYGMILALDENGMITDSLHDPSGTVIPSVSQVTEHDGVLYIGSFESSFIGKLRLTNEN